MKNITTYGQLFNAIDDKQTEMYHSVLEWLSSYSELASPYYVESSLNDYSVELSEILLKSREYYNEFDIGIGISSILIDFDYGGRNKEEYSDWSTDDGYVAAEILASFETMDSETLDENLEKFENIENKLGDYIKFLEDLGFKKGSVQFDDVVIDGKNEGKFLAMDKNMIMEILQTIKTQEYTELRKDTKLLGEKELNLLNSLNFKKKRIVLNFEMGQNKDYIFFIRDTLQMFLYTGGEHYLKNYLEKEDNNRLFREMMLLSLQGHKQEKKTKNKI